MTLTFSIDWTLRCGKGTNRKTQWFTTHETVPCKSKRPANWSPKMGWQKSIKTIWESVLPQKYANYCQPFPIIISIWNQ